MKVYGYYNKKKGNEDKLKKSNEGIMVKKKEVHIKVEEKRKESNKRKKEIRESIKRRREKEIGNLRRGISEKGMQQFFQ